MIIDNQRGSRMSHNKYSSFVYKGKSLKEWAKENGVKMATVKQRLSKGYSVEVAITPKKLNYDPTYQ
jgi:lambda repressor-like predicted transcriptional regulator